MKLSLPVLGALLIPCACGPLGERAARGELREGSAHLGLALVEVRGKRIAVIPFDGPESYYESEYGQPLTEAFGRDGRLVAWHPTSVWGPTDLMVTSIQGSIIAKVRAPSPDFDPGAISEQAGLLEFWGTVPGDHHQAGLHWATLDLSRMGFIDSLQTGDDPWGDWSPDGSMLAYATEGAIHIFDMRNQRSRTFLPGRDPTWAPNGKWISFRGPDGLATLVTLDGAPVHWAIGRHKLLSPLRWAPDGRYVDFSEAARFPLVGEYYRNVVCRVSDGKMIVARKLGIGWPDLLGFHWILEYKHFCQSCKPGEPFG